MIKVIKITEYRKFIFTGEMSLQSVMVFLVMWCRYKTYCHFKYVIVKFMLCGTVRKYPFVSMDTNQPVQFRDGFVCVVTEQNTFVESTLD